MQITQSVEQACYIYLRVSTARQAKDGLSLANQRLKCVKYAKEHNYVIKDVYEERGVSGKSMNRKMFNEMKKCLRSGDIIIINAYARLGRNVKEMINAHEDLKKAGVRIISLNELHIDDTTAHGKFVLNMMFNMAEYELNETTARSKAIINNKIICGEKIAHLAYGFNEHIWDGRVYVYPNVAEQRAISFIISARNSKPPKKWVDIKQELEDNLWKPKNGGEKWSVSSINTIYQRCNKQERPKELYGISCHGLNIYEKYKVPLIVPESDILSNIDADTGDFDYLKYFGYMYGNRGVHLPSLDTMKSDLDSGRIITSEDNKNAINNAYTNGLSEDGTPLTSPPPPKRVDIFAQDKAKIKIFFELFGDVSDPDELNSKALLFFQ